MSILSQIIIGLEVLQNYDVNCPIESDNDMILVGLDESVVNDGDRIKLVNHGWFLKDDTFCHYTGI